MDTIKEMEDILSDINYYLINKTVEDLKDYSDLKKKLIGLTDNAFAKLVEIDNKVALLQEKLES